MFSRAFLAVCNGFDAMAEFVESVFEEVVELVFMFEFRVHDQLHLTCHWQLECGFMFTLQFRF